MAPAHSCVGSFGSRTLPDRRGLFQLTEGDASPARACVSEIGQTTSCSALAKMQTRYVICERGTGA